MPAKTYNPNFITKRSNGGGLPQGSHVLSDKEYTDLLKLLPYAGYEPLTMTDGTILTQTNGNILFGKESP